LNYNGIINSIPGAVAPQVREARALLTGALNLGDCSMLLIQGEIIPFRALTSFYLWTCIKIILFSIYWNCCHREIIYTTNYLHLTGFVATDYLHLLLVLNKLLNIVFQDLF